LIIHQIKDIAEDLENFKWHRDIIYTYYETLESTL